MRLDKQGEAKKNNEVNEVSQSRMAVHLRYWEEERAKRNIRT